MGFSIGNKLVDPLDSKYWSAEYEDNRHRFQTYTNYVAALKLLIDSHCQPEIVRSTIEASDCCAKLQKKATSRLDDAYRSLRNAWATETHISLLGREEKLLQTAAHWVPVQVYYAVLHGFAAYHAASGQREAKSHKAFQSSFVSLIKSRPDLLVLPLKTLCVGDPESPQFEHSYTSDVVSSNLAVVTSENAPQYYNKFLKTTRKDLLEKRVDSHKKETRKKRLSGEQRSLLCESLEPTTLVHGLYRLRERSNYRDADSVCFSLPEPNLLAEFHQGLCSIASALINVFEISVRRLLGKARFSKEVQTFCDFMSVDSSLIPVRRRWAS